MITTIGIWTILNRLNYTHSNPIPTRQAIIATLTHIVLFLEELAINVDIVIIIIAIFCKVLTNYYGFR